MAMAMAGQTTTEGSQTGQGLSSSDGYETLQLQIRSVQNTVLMYSLNEGRDQPVTVQCDILQGDLKLMERNWTRLVNTDSAYTTRTEHMCLYELWENGSVWQLLMTIKSSGLKGVILVNDTGKVEDSFWDDKEIDVPVCIISSSSCEDLLKYLGVLPSSDVKFRNVNRSSPTAMVKISANYGTFNLECGSEIGKVQFSFPTICCRMLSQKLPCLQVIPESEETRSYYVQEYQGIENLQHIHGALAKNKLIAGIVIINVPEEIAKEQNTWEDPPIYFISTSAGKHLVQLLGTLNVPRKVPFCDENYHHSPERVAKVVPIVGELQYTAKATKELKIIPFCIFGPLELAEFKYPPFSQPLHCADAKKSQSGKTELPFLVYYSLKNDDKDVDLFHAIHRDNEMHASGVIVINTTDSCILDSSFFSDKKEAKRFPLPLIVVSSRHFRFPLFLSSNKEKVTLFPKEGKVLFGGRNKGKFDAIILNPCSSIPVPTDLKGVLFPDDNAVSQSLHYFRIVRHSEGMTYSTVFQKYEDEVKSGTLVGFIVTLNVKSRRIVLPTNLFIGNENSVQIPVIGMAKTDLATLLHSKSKSTASKQESEGTMGRIFKSVKSFLGYSSKFPISELLRSIEWDKCRPLMAYDKVAEKVKAWELVSDRDEALKILTSVLKLTGLRHLPVHILAAWNMKLDPTMETDYLQAIYDVAKGEGSDVLVRNIMAYKELVSQNRDLSYLLQATEHFVQKSKYPVVLSFWITLHLSVCEIFGKRPKSVQWSLLYTQGCTPMKICEEDCAILQKWIVLGQLVKIQQEYRFDLQSLSLLVSKSSISSFTSLKIIVGQFNEVTLKTPGQVHYFLKTLRENTWFSKLTFARKIILEGVHFLHDTVMLPYCIGDNSDSGLLNELGIWWRNLVRKFYFRMPEDCIACYKAIQSVLTNSQCICSAKMMDVVNIEVLYRMESESFMKNVSPENFYLLFKEISCISQQVVKAVLKHRPLTSLPSKKDPAFKLMTLALERFPNEEMSDVVSSVILKATSFQHDGRAFDALLHMDMPQLFPVSASNMRSICQKFTTEVKKEIEKRRLKNMVQDCFLKWLVWLEHTYTPRFNYNASYY